MKKKMSIDEVINDIAYGDKLRKLPSPKDVDFTPCLERINWLIDHADIINAVRWIFHVRPDYANAILRMVYMTGENMVYLNFWIWYMMCTLPRYYSFLSRRGDSK